MKNELLAIATSLVTARVRLLECRARLLALEEESARAQNMRTTTIAPMVARPHRE